MMNSKQWEQIKEIFHAALEVAPDERMAFLDKACAGKDSIRLEVESLIKSHENKGSFMDSPAFEVGAELLVNETGELENGALVGDYRILKKIGRGGMGEVYLAKDKKLGRNVALKVLPGYLNELTDRLRRFETEACAASALNHPNILTIYGIGKADSKHYIVTEYIEGETLRQHLLDEEMQVLTALDIANQVASALSAAHEAGIIHRDIKPENIMLRRDGYVKVLDFGLAKLAEDWRGADEDAPTRPLQHTDSGVVMGTARYMSPEQARGVETDARTDIWSLGVVLYEMIAGHTPFGGETSSHTIVSILEDDAPPLKATRPDVPAELEWIIAKALRKNREERYQTAKELLGDLKELKHKLEFQAQLERSQPAKTGAESGGVIKRDAPRRASDATVLTERVEAALDTSSYETLSSSFKRNWRWALVAIVTPLLAIALTIAGYKLWSSRRVESRVEKNSTQMPAVPTLRPKQVTSWAGLDFYPSFSPDGNSVVYSSDHDGSFEIYVQQLTPGGREIKLTSDGQQNLQPVWSPDGQRIAYHSSKRGGIWVVPAFGGAPKQLTDFGSRPAWSPDSAWIAFQSQSAIDFQINSPGIQPPSTIWIVAAAGGPAKQVTHEKSARDGQGAPCWSPDGRRIAFVAVDMGSISAEIWSVPRDGGEPKLLTAGIKNPSSNFDPIYSPDGRSVYFTGGTGGRGWGLLRLPISPETGEATGEPVVVKETNFTIYRSPRISADGKRIVYSALDMTSNLWSIQVSSSGEATAPQVRLTQDTTFRKSSPAFSPDGKRIAYQRFVIGDNHDIWLMDADGKNQTQLTTDPGSELSPSWYPQGDKIAFVYADQQELTVRSIELQTGREEKLLDIPRDTGTPQLSPDGKTFAYFIKKDGATNIWTISLDDKTTKQITFEKDLAGWPRWSPDGQFIIYESRHDNNSYLKIIPRDGGEAKQLTFDAGESFTGGASPDGSKISFAGYRNNIWNIWWVTRDGQSQKQVTSNTKLNIFMRYPAWSPLGHQIVFEYAEVKGNIWVAELE